MIGGCAGDLSPEPEKLQSSSMESREPFALDVVDELNDGERLAVVVRVRAAPAAREVKASLRLKTLRDGTVVGEQFTDLRSLMPLTEGDTESDAPREGTFVMAAPSRGASDYQLELSWGGTARSEVASSPVPAPKVSESATLATTTPQVSLRNIEVASFTPDCKGSASCGVSFTVRGTMENREAARTVRRVTLGVGYLPRRSAGSLDQEGMIPHNEQFVTLDNVNLAPGASRPVELALTETLSREEATRLSPSLRVVRAEVAGLTDDAP